MAPRSLVEMCTRTAIKNISLINSIGDLSYLLARPILLKVDNATQLQEIQENCPHIVDDCVELWQRLINRDFGRDVDQKRYTPQNPRSWHKVYFKYKRERDAQLAADEAHLAEQFDQLKRQRARNEAVIMLPSEVPHRLRNSGAVAVGGGAGARRGGGGAGTSGSSGLTWGGGSRTKMTSGQDVLRRARREAREVAHRNAISGQIRAPAGQIARAPQAMLNDRRIAHNRGVDDPAKVLPPAPRKKAGGLLASGRSGMEARLHKAKEGAGNPTAMSAPRGPKPVVRKVPVVVADDDGDDEDDIGTADDGSLFGGSPSGSRTSSAGGTPRRSGATRPPVARRQPSPLALNDDLEDLFGDSHAGSKSRRQASTVSSGSALKPPRPSPQSRPGSTPQYPPNSPPSATTNSSSGTPRPMSPPSGGPAPQSRKRKAVNIFMQPKKQPRLH